MFAGILVGLRSGFFVSGNVHIFIPIFNYVRDAKNHPVKKFRITDCNS